MQRIKTILLRLNEKKKNKKYNKKKNNAIHCRVAVCSPKSWSSAVSMILNGEIHSRFGFRVEQMTYDVECLPFDV